MRVCSSDGPITPEFLFTMTSTVGPDRTGVWSRGTDASRLITTEGFVDTDRSGTFNFRMSVPTGLECAAVLPPTEFLAAMRHPHTLQLGEKYGPFHDFHQFPPGQELIHPAELAYLRALAALQSHTATPILVPSLNNLTVADVRNVSKAVSLREGNVVVGVWEAVEVDVTNSDIDLAEHYQIAYDDDFVVEIGEQQISIPGTVTTTLMSAQLEDLGDGRARMVPNLNATAHRTYHPLGALPAGTHLPIVAAVHPSVEWARVQPRPDAYDPEGWGFYDAVIERIVAAGMTPMITLNHWVHPGWAVDRGGWNRPDMATDFIAFAKQAVDRYAWSNPLWITFNEPTEYVRRELMYGGLSPEHTMTMVDGIIRAHHEIYSYLHAVRPGAQVSSNIAFIPVPGVGPALESAFPDQMIDSLDFIGVDQYYSVSATDFSLYAFGLSGQYWNQSQAPESIYYVLCYLAGKYPGKPLRIIENGLATDPRQRRADGYRRADHLRDTIYWIQRAYQDGINVVSYNYWSLTDNYEWGDYTPRFGLYTVDAVTDPALTRRPTEAVQAYREITSRHGVSAAYRPHARSGRMLAGHPSG